MAAQRVLPTLLGRPHLVVPVARDRRGISGPTPAETRGPSWRQSTYGLYVPSSTEPSVEQRILEAATVLPSHGALTGWAATHWSGSRRWHEGLAPDGRTASPVWLAVGGEDIREQPGIRVSAERLDPRDIIVVDGVRVTTAVRSTCFDMRYASDARAAARVLSMATYHDTVSIAEMTEYAGRHSGWTGIPQCRAALALAEENCWSPVELDMVLIWRLDASLPRPLCNRPIFDRQGHHVGTPDLLDEEAGVVGEYDGTLHLHGAQRTRDVNREERFRRLGLEYFTVLSSHRAAPLALAERMRAVRARAAWAAPSSRDWTIEQPPWWTSTHTVALRRDLPSELRPLLLSYRAA